MATLEIHDTEVTIDEVGAEYDEAVEMAATGRNPYPGMSYAEGVKDTLAWVLGDSDQAPLTGDE